MSKLMVTLQVTYSLDIIVTLFRPHLTQAHYAPSQSDVVLLGDEYQKTRSI
jgi:hypothetical protein